MTLRLHSFEVPLKKIKSKRRRLVQFAIEKISMDASVEAVSIGQN